MPISPANHPAAEKLAAFGLGHLSDADSTDIEMHLADCDECRDRLGAVPDDALVSTLRASADQTYFGHYPLVMHEVGPSVSDGQSVGPSVGPSVPDGQKMPSISAAREPGTGSPMYDSVPRELQRHERYLALEPLGMGGMGTVIKARHRMMDRVVAIKIINPQLISKPGAKERRFAREIKAAADCPSQHCHGLRRRERR